MVIVLVMKRAGKIGGSSGQFGGGKLAGSASRVPCHPQEIALLIQ